MREAGRGGKGSTGQPGHVWRAVSAPEGALPELPAPFTCSCDLRTSSIPVREQNSLTTSSPKSSPVPRCLLCMVPCICIGSFQSAELMGRKAASRCSTSAMRALMAGWTSARRGARPEGAGALVRLTA